MCVCVCVCVCACVRMSLPFTHTRTHTLSLLSSPFVQADLEVITCGEGFARVDFEAGGLLLARLAKGVLTQHIPEDGLSTSGTAETRQRVRA